MKTLILLTSAITLSLSACTLTDARKEQLSQTGSYVAQKVAGIALQTVINGAVAASDKSRNVDFTQGLAEGLRAQEGNLLTSGDIKSLVGIWTPDKPAFNALGTQIAGVYAQVQPKTKQEAAAAVEGIARGLDKATAGR